MSDPFIAEIKMAGFNFAPRGYAFCDGSLLPISQNTALFSLLGTTYGGNGTTTFGLPNLIDRAALHKGQGNGLSDYLLGESAGATAVTLNTNQLPGHTHSVGCVTTTASLPSPIGNLWAPASGRTPAPRYQSGAPNAAMSNAAVGNTGGSVPHQNMQPYLGINFIIALQGIFPSRS